MCYNSSIREVKNSKLDQLTTVARAISDPTRVRLLLALRGRELCACQLYALAGMAPSTVSQHLSQLRQAGLVVARKQGRWVYYRLPEASVARQVGSVLAWLEQNLSAEEQVRSDAQRLEQILSQPPEELCRLQTG
jgi:ArsR family transcriptional regulator, arsenate/arsenite/antimonite-responsive transcriptional repressor